MQKIQTIDNNNNINHQGIINEDQLIIPIQNININRRDIPIYHIRRKLIFIFCMGIINWSSFIMPWWLILLLFSIVWIFCIILVWNLYNKNDNNFDIDIKYNIGKKEEKKLEAEI